MIASLAANGHPISFWHFAPATASSPSSAPPWPGSTSGCATTPSAEEPREDPDVGTPSGQSAGGRGTRTGAPVQGTSIAERTSI